MTNRMIHTPEGVRDIYGTELAKKLFVKDSLHKKLLLYGYEDIQTPTFEFFDIFSREVGTTPSRELYKFFDKEGNTLVLRPDFTPSIARCAAKYFMDDAAPIRLCYEGNVYTNVSELQGKLKETTQVGAELIGDNSVDADAEMICMVIDGLKACGLEEFQVSIGEMNYFKGICDEASLSEETLEELRSYISAKNYFGAEELLITNRMPQELIGMLLEVSEISSIEELRALKKKISNQRSLRAIERLEQVYETVASQYGLEKYISFDLGMLSKFHYYTGIIVKAYTYGVGDAIVKGGRYDALLTQFGKEAPAIGCVFLLDDIMSALNAQKIAPDVQENTAWYVYDEVNQKDAMKEIADRRKKGLPTVAIPYQKDRSQEDYQRYAAKHSVKEVHFYISLEK
ncbi:MAG: ATP phosphoribosyltransferase regulatory subunit [Lachnospiraceae bacterium]|nr:ATP phosphoribosyltransferase regulatory subunit [Lachnospiraceae bacterium]